MRWFAEHQLFTPIIETARGLVLGAPAAADAIAMVRYAKRRATADVGDLDTLAVLGSLLEQHDSRHRSAARARRGTPGNRDV